MVTILIDPTTNDTVGFSTNREIVRVFGAIKAREECLKCHSVKVGELLGALDYHLRRTKEYEQRPLQNSLNTAAE